MTTCFSAFYNMDQPMEKMEVINEDTATCDLSYSIEFEESSDEAFEQFYEQFSIPKIVVIPDFEEDEPQEEDSQIENPYLFQAELEGLDPIEVTKDKNCFFRAVSSCLLGNEDDHVGIRQTTMKNINKRKDNDTSTFGGRENCVTEAQMTALAQSFNLELVVYTKSDIDTKKNTFRGNKVLQTVSLLLINGYFQLLMPKGTNLAKDNRCQKTVANSKSSKKTKRDNDSNKRKNKKTHRKARR